MKATGGAITDLTTDTAVDTFYGIVHDNIDVDLPLLDVVDLQMYHIPMVIHLRSLSNSAELMLG